MCSRSDGKSANSPIKSKTTTAKCFDSYDFSTLYTNIPHATLKEALKALIQEAYKVRGSEYIVADTNDNAYWSEVISTSSAKYNITKKSAHCVRGILDRQYLC